MIVTLVMADASVSKALSQQQQVDRDKTNEILRVQRKRHISASELRRTIFVEKTRIRVQHQYNTRSKRADRAAELRREKKLNRRLVRKLRKHHPDNRPLIKGLCRCLWEASVELDVLAAQDAP